MELSLLICQLVNFRVKEIQANTFFNTNHILPLAVAFAPFTSAIPCNAVGAMAMGIVSSKPRGQYKRLNVWTHRQVIVA